MVFIKAVTKKRQPWGLSFLSCFVMKKAICMQRIPMLVEEENLGRSLRSVCRRRLNQYQRHDVTRSEIRVT